MDAVAITDLPDGVQSLSELIGIQNTTQAALYVTLRDTVTIFDDAEYVVRSALPLSPFSLTNISSHCEL